ncbi:unnamed protein product [Rotaria socialis]|uniref:Uncharacterized protein n=1 Tax=Rotaria socialis TaxID=392032 RepID=A0A817XMZ1_9BILA|nr:unnamed protein product [Rotaria socialis]CAF4431311.1 unnamed protein product [Rotaria socialis]
MVVDKTHYDVLGIDENATQEHIISAFRQKSKEHHPDRGGTHEMMQKINAAKEVLTDPKKRAIYDRYGSEGPSSGMAHGHSTGFPGFSSGSPDIFDFFMRGASGREPTIASKGSDIKHALQVSLEELYSGHTKKISVPREIICTACDGTGSVDRINHDCTACKGQGVENLIFRTGPFIQQSQRSCSFCSGLGTRVNAKNRCKICHGNKLVRQEKILDVDISPGSPDGGAIKFIGEGNQIPQGENGSLYVVLRQAPHAIFERIGDNLTMNLKINLSESLCGFQHIVTLLDGHKIRINHPPGKPIVPKSYRCIKGQGMPNRHTHSYGDLFIYFDVEFPEDNFIKNESQLKQLEASLPPKRLARLNSTEKYEEAQMIVSEPPPKNSQQQQQQRFENGHHYHRTEHDDGGGTNGHPQTVQCETQ